MAETAIETVVETEVTELAPMMARTASDPAPMMSLDATTVMPPLSLLPRCRRPVVAAVRPSRRRPGR